MSLDEILDNMETIHQRMQARFIEQEGLMNRMQDQIKDTQKSLKDLSRGAS